MNPIKKQQKDFFIVHKDVVSFVDKKHILLFLDFDGTLAAIVGHYKNATILKESKVLLRKIAKTRDCSIAIVSGRALDDVKKRVGLRSIIYVGNHGMEIDGPGVKSTFFVKMGDRIRLKLIKHDLMTRIGQIKGIVLEDKGLSITVHYRLVNGRDLRVFKRKFLECLEPYLQKNEVSLNEGKKVLEINPKVRWDKGKAILWLIDNFQEKGFGKKAFPIFIGDDVTDETAFKALKRKGLCIRVGESKSSAAPYFLKDIKEVACFLKTILDSKTKS